MGKGGAVLKSCLVVSSFDKFSDALSEPLKQSGIYRTDTAASADAARRILIDKEYDLIIITAPLSDEAGLTFAKDVSEGHDCGIILCCRPEKQSAVEADLAPYGVFVLPLPVNRQVFYSAVRFSNAAVQRLGKLRKKERQLQKQLDDIKLIDRAKCCLIQCLGMTEQQAHRHIEKQAMDLRRPRRAIAEDILKTYEL